MATITITGNTYPVKDQIKALGGRWNARAQGWDVPVEKANEARALVAGAPKSASRCPNPRDCGDPTCDGSCGY